MTSDTWMTVLAAVLLASLLVPIGIAAGMAARHFVSRRAPMREETPAPEPASESQGPPSEWECAIYSAQVPADLEEILAAMQDADPQAWDRHKYSKTHWMSEEEKKRWQEDTLNKLREANPEVGDGA